VTLILVKLSCNDNPPPPPPPLPVIVGIEGTVLGIPHADGIIKLIPSPSGELKLD
jgi:hypothetical protein